MNIKMAVKLALVGAMTLAAAESEPPDAFFYMPQEAVPVCAAYEPETSGPVTSLPWEGLEAFQTKQHETGATVLMGAYRAVLRDPLPGEEYNVHLAASLLSGTIVKPGQVFSQNGSIGPYTAERGFQRGPTYVGTTLTTTIGGGVCKIASTLYNVVVLSDLKIVERHCHTMPVPYVPYGQDATVSYGSRDFKFMNDTPFPLLIWAEGIDNKLYIAFYGQRESPRVEWMHEITGVQKAPNAYKTVTDLPPGGERLALEGMDGATVKSFVSLRYADGSVVVRQMPGSHYQPMPNVVERGR